MLIYSLTLKPWRLIDRTEGAAAACLRAAHAHARPALPRPSLFSAVPCLLLPWLPLSLLTQDTYGDGYSSSTELTSRAAASGARAQRRAALCGATRLTHHAPRL